MNTVSDELLVSRVIDGEQDPGEWDELTARAEQDPSLWRTIAEAHRDHASFARGVNTAVGAAEAIEPPVRPEQGRLPHAVARPRAALLLGAWGGWAVAAVLMITWSVRFPEPVAMDGRIQEAGIGTSVPAADLLQAYLDRGRQEDFVIGEVPEKVLIDSRPAPSGDGYELLYLRQVLERAIVPDLYQFTAQDELGRPTLVRFEGYPGRSM